ncbi:hypothetical protein [Fusobacterium sp. PH5-44]|uniref:hypothetical protein n=1 Tax=unclassified Fusobacterium TaxID=2648384 RepID=UPI003D235B31
MKKILLVALLVISAISFGGIFGSGGNSAEIQYLLTTESAKNWEKTITDIIKREAYIEDWYGDDDVIIYLRKTGIMKEKDFQFLSSLSKKEEYEIVGDDYKEFVSLVDKYRKKMPRTFALKSENLKSPAELARRIVVEASLSGIDNPAKQIKAVADPKDWNELMELAKIKNFTKKETKALRKILNDVMKKEHFYNANVWYNKEMSSRTKKLAELNSGVVGKQERNNINAKAMYLAYPDYLSQLDKWGK